VIAAQPRLLDVPLAELSVVSVTEVNELLAAWGHRLGPIHRPFRMEAYALTQHGRPLSVAVSASTVSSHVAGWLDLANKERPVRFHRQEVVELARLASAPDAAWATRVMLRLWREVCARRWACWPVRAAVSYSHNVLHAGGLYRFDGWVRINDRCGSSGGGHLLAPTIGRRGAAWPEESLALSVRASAGRGRR
jgi:hypothetical protein